MRYGYSARLRDDLNSRVLAALRARGMVNIAVVAEDVRLRNLDENVALEDVERLVMQTAQLYGAVMELDGLTSVQAGRSTWLADDKHELPGIDNSDTTGGQTAPLQG
jgi:predicted YcjX-like family ATPase